MQKENRPNKRKIKKPKVSTPGFRVVNYLEFIAVMVFIVMVISIMVAVAMLMAPVPIGGLVAMFSRL